MATACKDCKHYYRATEPRPSPTLVEGQGQWRDVTVDMCSAEAINRYDYYTGEQRFVRHKPCRDVNVMAGCTHYEPKKEQGAEDGDDVLLAAQKASMAMHGAIVRHELKEQVEKFHKRGGEENE